MPVSTKFRKVPYTVAGDSFVSSAKDLSVQRTKNMFIVPAVNSLTNTAAVYSWPGLKLWSSGTAGEYDRGIHRRLFNSKAWKVSGSTLYSINSSGTQTNEGVIAGSSLVSIEDNGLTLIIVADGKAYSHNGTTLSTISLSFTPVQCAYLNERFILLADNGDVYLSDVNSTTFGNEIAFQAKSSPDETRGISVFDQFLFVGGQNTIEPWQDIGSGNPPFSRINGVIIENAGIANRHCFAQTSKSLYFLGDDKKPYSLVSFQANSIADKNPGILEQFYSYTKETAYMDAIKWNGYDFILFVFPTEQVFWVYCEQTGIWCELDHDDDSQFYLGKTFSWLFNKILVGDRSNGNIYELDSDTYQDNGVQGVRERVFRPLSGEAVGAPRAYLQMKVIQFAMETGVGSSDDNPQVLVSYSTDGGRNYSSESAISLGEEGDYQELVEDYSNRKFKDLAVKIRYVENTRFTLYDSAIYVREAGR